MDSLSLLQQDYLAQQPLQLQVGLPVNTPAAAAGSFFELDRMREHLFAIAIAQVIFGSIGVFTPAILGSSIMLVAGAALVFRTQVR